ncbi:MAG: hypothetical protein ABIR68_07935 [Ilumatobacteraceae bacterium]
MPQIGFFELYPSIRPALTAGTYVAAADHDLVAAPLNNADGHLAVDGADFTFKILSPRFTMPPEQILSTFPPAGSVGDWHQRLPQIVFKRRTLPWEHNPTPGQPPATAPPWLALVVLAEGEGSMSATVPAHDCVTPGTVMEAADDDTSTGRFLEVRTSLVQRIFPTVEDLGLLTHVRRVDLADTELALGDDDGYLAVVVANRLPQPGPPPTPGADPASVKYTAYLLNLEGQIGSLPTEEQTEVVFEFVQSMPDLLQTELFQTAPGIHSDVLVMQGLEAAKLLPKAAVAEAASATRVERASGFEQAAASWAVGPAAKVATSADDARVIQKWQDGASLVELSGAVVFPIVALDPPLRFPVLVSWDFVCTGSGTFEDLMQGLETGMLGTEDEHGDPALAPDIAVTGHISLEHRTRRGESTSSWYRGPLVPQPTDRTGPAADGSLPLANTGDQLRRIVPDGHEDVGTAAAFEIGRLLALSKPGIVASMMAWREELFGAARVHQLATGMFEGVFAGFAASALAGKGALQGLVADQVMVTYSENAATKVGPAVKEFAASRVPDAVAASEPQDVLLGFGLDGAQVRAATEQFGVAGLGRLDVAVSQATMAPLSTVADDLQRVSSRLSTHVDDVAAEALGLSAIDPATGVRTRLAPAFDLRAHLIAPPPGARVESAAVDEDAPEARAADVGDTLDLLLAEATRKRDRQAQR